MQAEQKLPDKAKEIIVYCAGGTRSAFAAKTLAELGYTNVSSANPGFVRWKDLKYPVEQPPQLSEAQLDRYSRHIMLPEVGEKGQAKLLKSRVLLLGAGGLGAPSVALPRRRGRRHARPGRRRRRRCLEPAAPDRARDLAPRHAEGRQRGQGAHRPQPRREGREVRGATARAATSIASSAQAGTSIVDGCDNFPTRYLVNDASLFHKIPVVHGSIFRFEGQVTTFKPFVGPCYRCLYPEPPPPHLAPSCAEAGVLGILPGIIGTLQATEAIKLILGQGDPLIGRLLTYDSLRMTFRTLKLRRDKNCPACGENPTIKEYIDYEGFCAGPAPGGALRRAAGSGAKGVRGGEGEKRRRERERKRDANA